MSKSSIRIDKTCLNCNHVVEKRFCGNCGQENIDTRKTFHHLFIHFFEDLTHYENAFWKTIRNLLFKPASLTKEYLSGKRMSYLAPVRLYIFISFITFLLIALIPSGGFVQETTSTGEAINDSLRQGVTKQELQLDSLLSKSNLSAADKQNIRRAVLNDSSAVKTGFSLGFSSVQEFDSIQKYGSQDEKVPEYIQKYLRKAIKITERYSKTEIISKLKKSVIHNFPKVLLIYMPLFAFFLWLVHSKKRWYYFDHGIFTLHYFSFLLLVSLTLFLINTLLEFFDQIPVVPLFSVLINLVGYVWMFYYFFPAHYRFYGGTKFGSMLTSIALLVFNFIIIILLLVGLFLYSFITIL